MGLSYLAKYAALGNGKFNWMVQLMHRGGDGHTRAIPAHGLIRYPPHNDIESRQVIGAAHFANPNSSAEANL